MKLPLNFSECFHQLVGYVDKDVVRVLLYAGEGRYLSTTLFEFAFCSFVKLQNVSVASNIVCSFARQLIQHQLHKSHKKQILRKLSAR